MKKLNSFVHGIGFPIMLNQSNEKGLFAPNISVLYKTKNGLYSFKVARASKLVHESRVRGIVVLEASLVVIVEET